MTKSRATVTEEPVTALSTIEPMKQAIAVATEAGDIDQLRDIAATAAALKEGAKARGMGIKAENKATLVVVRAERGIGKALMALQSEGQLRSRGQRLSSPSNEGTVGIGDIFPEVPLGTAERWAENFRALAQLDEAEFEALLEEAAKKAERIARIDFYRAAKPAKSYTPPGYAEGQSVPPTEQVDPVFAALRDATRQAFGWQPDGEGGGTYTSNALLNMHVDDLAQVAAFVQQWATGYAEAKSARRAA